MINVYVQSNEKKENQCKPTINDIFSLARSFLSRKTVKEISKKFLSSLFVDSGIKIVSHLIINFLTLKLNEFTTKEKAQHNSLTSFLPLDSHSTSS